MKDFVETRNSDKALILKYWELIDKIPMDSMSNFKSAFLTDSTSTESIRRARQLVQEDGKYLPTDETIIARRYKQYKMVGAIKNNREVV